MLKAIEAVKKVLGISFCGEGVECRSSNTYTNQKYSVSKKANFLQTDKLVISN